MIQALTGIADQAAAAMTRERGPASNLVVAGRIVVELFDPDGKLRVRSEQPNIITQIGDQYYGERAAGIGSPPGQVTGMKLGTGSTAVAKTGAGAALVTYLSNSHQALAGGYPTSALSGSSLRDILWQATWAAGKATTASAITEVTLVNDALADSTSTAANTISRALVTGVANKGAADTLTITWTHTIGT
jgi:hypothetical protein